MNTFEGKKSADKWFPVRLVDSGDYVTPETAIAFGSVTVKYGAEAATSESTYVVSTNDWKEQGDGNYWLRIGADEFAAEGKYIIKVEAAGCADYNCVVEVRDKTLAELIDDVVAILDDTGTAGVKLDLAQVNTSDNDPTHVGGQIRRTHSLAGGCKATKDHSAANPTWSHRNEADNATLITRARGMVGSIESETPS